MSKKPAFIFNFSLYEGLYIQYRALKEFIEGIFLLYADFFDKVLCSVNVPDMCFFKIATAFLDVLFLNILMEF